MLRLKQKKKEKEEAEARAKAGQWCVCVCVRVGGCVWMRVCVWPCVGCSFKRGCLMLFCVWSQLLIMFEMLRTFQ